MRKYDAEKHSCSSFITVISGFIYWICMIVIVSTIKTVWGRVIAVIAAVMSVISVLGMSVFSTEEVLKEVEENREE